MSTDNVKQGDPVSSWIAGDRALAAARPFTQGTIRRLRERAGLPFHQPVTNGTIYYDLDEVDAWLRNRCIEDAPGERGAA